MRFGQSVLVEPHRLRVHLTLLSTELGGRSKPVFSGYRCQWRCTRKPEWNDAKLELQKQRNGEVQHYSQYLWFNKAAQQFATNSRRHPVEYVTFRGEPVSSAHEYQ